MINTQFIGIDNNKSIREIVGNQILITTVKLEQL